MPSVSDRLPTTPSRAPLWPWLIAIGTIVLLPVGRASELAIASGAIAGIAMLVRDRVDPLRDPRLRLATLLFACYWIPALLSGLAPVAPARTWSTIASLIRFLPFAWFATLALGPGREWRAAVAAVAAVLALWVVDALVQAATGYSLGGAAEAERVSGIFGAGNLKLGPALAVLSPFALIAARERFGRIGLAIAFLVVAIPILLSGSRAAWLMYAMVAIVMAWREAGSWRTFALTIAGGTLAIAAVVGVALHDSARFDARIERSLLALRGTDAAIDAASAGRLRIWRTALAMSAAHPVTGVGVRGFRYAYPDFAAPGDTFVDAVSDTGASHAHQIVLEVLTETGIVGLAFWIAGAWLALRAWRRADAPARERARAPALALLVMCFPIDTHLAFYSAWWGLLFWWLLAIYCAALAAPLNPASRPRAAA